MWKFIWGVEWWSPARWVSSGDVKTSAVGALLKVGICGLFEEVFHWRTTSSFLERVSSRIGVKSLTRRPEQKYWIKFLKDIQLKQTLRELPWENRRILDSRSRSLRGANITQVWSSLINAYVPNKKPQANRDMKLWSMELKAPSPETVVSKGTQSMGLMIYLVMHTCLFQRQCSL